MKREDPELPVSDGNEENNSNNDFQEEFDEEFDEIYGDEDYGVDFIEPEGGSEMPCSFGHIFLNLLKMPKPLGYHFPQDKIVEFLKERGYKIINRYSDTMGEEYPVAIKPGSSYVPGNDYSNVREVFDEEVQDILLKWLLKIGKED